LTWLLKRFSDRGWGSFPRPNQLYSEELMMDVSDAWADECKIALQIAQCDHFRIAHEAALQPVQGEYVGWLMGQVRARGIDAWRPLSRLLKERVLTPDMVAAQFGPATLKDAQRVAAM
jgi:hypothetical protein